MKYLVEVIVVFSLLVAALPIAAARRTDITIVADIPSNAQRQLVGSGIALPGGLATRGAQDSRGRAIVWREYKRGTDPEGAVHVLYRQYLGGSEVQAELVGAEIGLHYDADGALTAVHGAQFESVHVVNHPSLERDKATTHALNGLRDYARAKSLAIEDIDRLHAPQLAVLEVRTDERSAVQRFVWRLPIRDVGLVADVLVDAQSGAVLATQDTMRLNACFPDSLTSTDAHGVPVRAGNGLPSTAVRWVGATPSSRHGYSHEAFWSVGGAPLFAVHQWMPDDDSRYDAFRCADQSGKQYGLIPLAMGGNGYPVYTDDTLFEGRAAGDAIYNTFLTMDAFWRLGRNSFDGNYGNATVIVNSPSAGDYRDTAWFHPGYNVPGQTPLGMPPGASVNIAPPANYWNAASSLDWIAHEWGHGVTEGQFDLTTFMGRTMSEGLSDVIATIVEKTEQPSSSTANPSWSIIEQSADWVMHEDAAQGGYARGAEDDGSTGHTWVARVGTSRTFRDMIHRQDPDVSLANEGHTPGNMLVMAMRLMSAGGKNPICLRPSASFQGCPAQEAGPNGTTVNNPPITGIGFEKTSKIWWHAITNWYLGQSTTWNNIADSMVLAARNKYRRCPSTPALAEQNAVLLAFRYIGYPGTVTAQGCP
ncbi:MAG TPA: M4 family metallopeptidase [Thermoanaerobaculia bacterium]